MGDSIKMDSAMPDRRAGLLLVMMEVDPSHDEDFNRWYDQEHLPERRHCPGFLSARRFRAVEGSPKYLAVYDLQTTDVLKSAAYKKVFAPSPWAERVQQYITYELRNVYEDITSDPTSSMSTRNEEAR
jgi:hypothetical protein